MATFVRHEECPECGSKDNLARYSDGSASCFGADCEYYERGDGSSGTSSRAASSGRPLLTGECLAIRSRGLDRDTCERFRYQIAKSHGNAVQVANYVDKRGLVVAQKVRDRNKRMWWVGSPNEIVPLYGYQLWKPGDRRTVIVTEGEVDALSMSQVQDNKYPVVSIANGAGNAARDLRNETVWTFLESFEQIVLMFDEDEPGRKAAAECAELFTPGKVCIARLPLKDANEMLLSGRRSELISAAWQAAPYRPDGVVRGEDLWDLIKEEPEPGLSYPWAKLDEMTHGQRKGEIVVWAAGTGIGKSQILKEVAYDLALRHEKKVGIISLEESVRHSALCQISIHMSKPLHLPEYRREVDIEALREAFDETLATKRFVFYDHFGSVEADRLLPKISFMAIGEGCEYIILDHISIAVSGMATEGDERKRLDELMTKLRSLVQKQVIGLHIITHLRRPYGRPHEEGGRVALADLRGSGAIGQLADLAIGAERDQQSKKHKHHTFLRVIKNRYSGDTGRAGCLEYTPYTGRLHYDPLIESPDDEPAPAEADEQDELA